MFDEADYSTFNSCWNPELYRLFVISMPKSGTYLLAKMLENMGYVDCEVHVSENAYSDYRGLSNAQKMAMASRVNVSEFLERTLGRICRGQLAVGHIGYNFLSETLLGPFQKIVSVRNPRYALVSAMRFEERRIRSDPEWHAGHRDWIYMPTTADRLLAFMGGAGGSYIADFKKVVPWLNMSSCHAVRFEEFTGINGRERQLNVVGGIAQYVGQSNCDVEYVLASAIGADTLTYSGQYSNLAGFWSPDMEDIFEANGGRELCELLHYPNSLDPY